MKRKLIQVDFYPNGFIDYWYEGEQTAVTSKTSIKGQTPAEALQKRLEEYKKNKNKTK